MLEVILSLTAIVLIPVIIGYVYGRNNIDPNTAEGKVYYE